MGKSHYTLKRFSRVINENCKRTKEVAESGRISDPIRQAETEAELQVMEWVKRWIDNIRKYKKLKQ